MPRPRMQFTVRTLAVVIALIALNLAAVLISWRWYQDSLAQPREEESLRLRSRPRVLAGPDGAIHIVAARMRETGEQLERVVWPLPPPTLLQIGCPVVASLSITILVLAVPWPAPASRNDPAPSDAAGSTERSSPSRLGLVRWALIAAGLFGLNLAAAAYRPMPDPSERGSHLITGSGKPGFLSEGGRFVIGWSDGSFTRPRPGDVMGHILETVIYRPDGSVVAYEGSPGLLRRLFTWPWVLREPSHSRPEMWWPTFAAAAITLLVLRALWLQAQRPPDVETLWFGEDSTRSTGPPPEPAERAALP